MRIVNGKHFSVELGNQLPRGRRAPAPFGNATPHAKKYFYFLFRL